MTCGYKCLWKLAEFQYVQRDQLRPAVRFEPFELRGGVAANGRTGGVERDLAVVEHKGGTAARQQVRLIPPADVADRRQDVQKIALLLP